MKVRTRAAVIVISLALAGTACGGSDSDSDGAPTTVTRFPPTVPVNNEPLAEGSGACGLLNQAEVAAAVGTAADPGTGTRTKTNESCRWNIRAGSNQFVAVIVSPSGRQQFEQASNTLSGNAEPLSGVGDRAFVANDTAYALRGERLIILQVSTAQAVAARKQAVTKLVASAVGRG